MSEKQRYLLLTMGRIGDIKTAPGTFGSAVALIVALPILYFSVATLFLLTILIAIIAIREIDIFEKESGTHDLKNIVIDELIGMWLALSITGFNFYGIILAFIFFRIYDIKKPSIIGKIDEEVSGGLGVVGDDAIAGFFAGLSVMIILGIAGLFFGIDVGFAK